MWKCANMMNVKMEERRIPYLIELIIKKGK